MSACSADSGSLSAMPGSSPDSPEPRNAKIFLPTLAVRSSSQGKSSHAPGSPSANSRTGVLLAGLALLGLAIQRPGAGTLAGMWVILLVAYDGAMTGTFGQTLGKMTFGIRVVAADGWPLP